MKVFIIGAGNVAYHMYRAIERTSHDVVGVYSRKKEDSQQFDVEHYTEMQKINSDADIYIICVSDDSIQQVASELPSIIKTNKIVAHTSGSKDLDNTLNSCHHIGIFYPLQTFSKERDLDYASIPFCLNANNPKVLKTIDVLARSISKNVQVISDEERKKIHLSAVMINNFVNHLIYKSEELLKDEGIDQAILQPLLEETIKKQRDIGSLQSQTGPARRNDLQTIKSHLDLLEKKTDKKLYKAITKSIRKTYKTK